MAENHQVKVNNHRHQMSDELLKMLQNFPNGPQRKEISLDVQTSTETKQIILPKGLNKLDAARELERQYENEEQIINQHAEFPGWNYEDVLVAIKKVTEKEFGWMNAQSKEHFFGVSRPHEIDIVVDIANGRNITEKAFYGTFKISVWEDADASINIGKTGEVSIVLQAKRKYSKDITEYFELIRQHLQTASIYRGRNIVVTKGQHGMKFTIIENKVSEKIVLNESEEVIVDELILSALGEKGKRIYLFTGKYGTGKTETAMRVGKVAVEKHGMSFFYIKDASLFEEVLKLSKNYQPALLFLEDIDEIASGNEHDSRMNSILNTLDGLETKGNDVQVIFTTNHANKINPALRRPGRIDLVVKFDNMTKEAKMKLMKMYFAGLPGEEKIDYEKVIDKMPDAQGAVIAEICKRVVKLQSARGGLTDKLIMSCAASMKFQIELMEEPVQTKTKEQQFCELFAQIANSSYYEDEDYEDED